MSTKYRSGLTRVVVTATTIGVLAGLAAPVATAAEPARPAAASMAAATQLPEATQEEKVNAIRALGVDIDNTWLVLRDRDFVFKIFDTADSVRFPLVKDGALQAYRDGDSASTLFIRTTITDLAGRDRDNYARGQLERDQARKLKQSAAALVAMPVTDQQLDLGYRDFIYDLWRFVTGYPKVKAAALTAFGAAEPDQKIFLASGLLAAKRQDQQDAIDADNQKTEAEKARQKASNARQNAATVVALVTNDTLLDLPDDFFIRKILEKAVPGSEVAIAGQAALNSTNPADWTAYIATGIFAANQRDIDIARQKKAAEDRRLTREIKAKAENGLMRPRLVAAAGAALAGSDDAVAAFLKDGQYAVPEQTIEATTPGLKGYYVQSAGGDAYIRAGDAGTNGKAQLDAVTWKVKDGLADPNCFSLESTQFEGSYLRVNGVNVQLAANDGSTAFKNDATWCSKPGSNGFGVSLESKAQPGRFLRHWGFQLWAANSSDDVFYDASRLFKEDTTWSIVDPNPLVSTPITLRWRNEDGFRALLGDPKGDEVYDSFNGGVRYRDFANGRAYWNAATGVHAVLGPVLEKYKTSGEFHMKMPVIDTTYAPDGVGRFTHFENGISIYWSPSTGAHLVYGAIRGLWEQLGWEKSYLGYPTEDEAPAGNLRRSTFQHGNIDHDPSTGRTWDYRV